MTARAAEGKARGVMIVTGGSRGIGAATARLAAQQGYAVAINFVRNRDAADAVVKDIHDRGGEARAIRADVARESEVNSLFDEAARLGPLKVLVNNAGILERQCRLDEMDAGRFERVLATNVVGALLCAREAVRRMSTKHGGQGGAIVNVSSMAAQLLGDRLARHQRPPDTSMNVPVEYEASSEASHRIARATSSGWPPRRMGTTFLTRSTRSGSPPLAWMSV